MDFHRQPGQTSTDDIKKRDLRAELLAAEAEARNKKRKAEGKPLLEEDVRKAAMIEAPEEGSPAAEDDEANKRRKLLQEDLEMDKDDDEDEEDDERDLEANGEDGNTAEVEDPEEAAEEGFDEDFAAMGEMDNVPFL